MVMLAATGGASAQSPESSEQRASAASTAPAEAQPSASSPISIDQLTLSDDMLGAIGWRPIAEGRVEAAASTGNDSTHHAAFRASDTYGGVGVELTGYWL